MYRNYTNLNQAFDHVISHLKRGVIDIGKGEIDGESSTIFRETTIFEFSKPHERVLFNEVVNRNPLAYLTSSLHSLVGHLGIESDEYEIEGSFDCPRSIPIVPDELGTLLIGIKESGYGTISVCRYDKRHGPQKEPFVITLKSVGSVLHTTSYSTKGELITDVLGTDYIICTFLQEYVAKSLGMMIGPYESITNVLYVTEDHWSQENGGTDYSFLETMHKTDYKSLANLKPLISDPERFRREVQSMGGSDSDVQITEPFLTDVYMPMMKAYTEANDDNMKEAIETVHDIQSMDWFVATSKWIKHNLR